MATISYDIINPDGTRTTVTETIPPDQVTRQALQAAIDARLVQLETFIANNPNGAQLTNAQVLIVAKMLAGLARVVRGTLDSTGQAG